MNKRLTTAVLIATLIQSINSSCARKLQIEPIRVEEINQSTIPNLEYGLGSVTYAYGFDNDGLSILVNSKAENYEIIIKDRYGYKKSRKIQMGKPTRLDLPRGARNIQVELYARDTPIGNYNIPLYMTNEGERIIIQKGKPVGVDWSGFKVEKAEELGNFGYNFGNYLYEIYNSKTREIYSRFNINPQMRTKIPFHPEANSLRILYRGKVIGKVEGLKVDQETPEFKLSDSYKERLKSK